jgi:N-acetyl-S-(2-succino)cysteine monooxygenase
MALFSYRRHRFPPLIIQHAIWLYLRFTLSYRDVEDLLAERGLDLSYETVRRWVLKFGPTIARKLRRQRPSPSDRWHLDEMVIRIAGKPRYDRAIEFVEVVQGLWDSWDDDAFVRDRQSERYFDPAKLHSLNHKGEHFSVRGPLNVARPPQGHPVLFQAGSSEIGREVAARFAEGVFTPQHTLAGAQEFYRDLKGRMRKYDRPPEALKVMPGLNAIVGRSRKEAEELHHFLQSKIHPDVGLELLSNQLGGFDLSEHDLDGPLPDIPERQFALSGLGNTRNIIRWSREEGLTIRQIYQRFAAARGQRTLIGSPSDIADDMEEWFRGYGVDGFLFHPSHLPGGLDDFVALVIPELQSRGLFRAEYEGATLRENLGLERPKSRYVSR